MTLRYSPTESRGRKCSNSRRSKPGGRVGSIGRQRSESGGDEATVAGLDVYIHSLAIWQQRQKGRREKLANDAKWCVDRILKVIFYMLLRF